MKTFINPQPAKMFYYTQKKTVTHVTQVQVYDLFARFMLYIGLVNFFIQARSWKDKLRRRTLTWIESKIVVENETRFETVKVWYYSPCTDPHNNI